MKWLRKLWPWRRAATRDQINQQPPQESRGASAAAITLPIVVSFILVAAPIIGILLSMTNSLGSMETKVDEGLTEVRKDIGELGDELSALQKNMVQVGKSIVRIETHLGLDPYHPASASWGEEWERWVDYGW